MINCIAGIKDNGGNFTAWFSTLEKVRETMSTAVVRSTRKNETIP